VASEALLAVAEGARYEVGYYHKGSARKRGKARFEI
jgi:hypothetical protein